MNHRDAIAYCRRERDRAQQDVRHLTDELGYPTAGSRTAELRAVMYDCTALIIEAVGRIASTRQPSGSAYEPKPSKR